MSEIENKQRNKVRMNISISKEMYEFIRETRGNASKLAEQAYSALYSAVKQNKAESIVVMDLNSLNILQNSTKTPKNSMDPLEFESRISAMSRRRHSQLDHESSYNNALHIIVP